MALVLGTCLFDMETDSCRLVISIFGYAHGSKYQSRLQVGPNRNDFLKSDIYYSNW